MFENGVTEGFIYALKRLFCGEITVEKRTKSGTSRTEISGMIKAVSLYTQSGAAVLNLAMRDGPDGSLNPAYIIHAMKDKIADFSPVDVEYTRRGFL